MKFSPTYKRTKRIEELLQELSEIQRNYQNTLLNRDISTLSPRRQEIIATINEHRQTSFDFLSRNFRGVKPSTLHYDLQQLVKSGYIKKLGSTRGVVYVPTEEPVK